MRKEEVEKLKKKFPEGGYSEGVDVPPSSSHSWMSQSNYGGSEENAEPKEPLNYGMRGQSMKGELPDDNARPDDELQATIVEALESDMHVDPTNITVHVNYGVVTLRGTVSQRAAMNAALECVRKIHGVTEIVNDLRIQMS